MKGCTRLARRAVLGAVLLCAAAAGLQGCASGSTSTSDSGPDVFARHDEPNVRVRIRDAASSVSVSSTGSLRVGLAPGAGAPIGGSAVVTLADDTWIIREGAGSTRRLGATRPLRIEAGGSLRLDGAPHPGELWLHPRADRSPGAFDVVEHISMEEYLPGVLTKELFPNWSRGAYEAQAIAARTYAVQEQSRRTAGAGTFDVESTTDDQVYGGATDNPTALNAVRATRGLVLVSQGRPLRAYYSSTCGGRPQDASAVWPTGQGYEFNSDPALRAAPRAHACGTAPLYRWTVSRSIDDALRRIRAYGEDRGMNFKALPSIARIDVASRNSLGRPTEFRIVDSSGRTWPVNAEHLRHSLNFAAPGLAEVTRPNRIHSSDFQTVVRDGRITFSGRGFGHGVGMCQYCAEGFGSRGEAGRDIVVRFYPGARVERWW